MAVLEGGISAELLGIGTQTGSPLHSTGKPVPYSTLGHYRLCANTQTMAAGLAANAQVFYIRWTDATRLLVLLNLQVRFQPLILFTAATVTDFGFDMFKATSVSAGGAGAAIAGTAISKMRSTMPASLLGATDVRISTTTLLTALTTLDTNAIEQSIGDTQRVNPAAATEEQRVNDPTLIYQPDIASGEHPLVLSQNEGVVIRNRAVWPVAGTGIIQVRASWAEVTAY